MIPDKSMRSVESIVSVPHGEIGAKITITMTEETDLYDRLSAAWDSWRAAVASAEPAA